MRDFTQLCDSILNCAERSKAQSKGRSPRCGGLSLIHNHIIILGGIHSSLLLLIHYLQAAPKAVWQTYSDHCCTKISENS